MPVFLEEELRAALIRVGDVIPGRGLLLWPGSGDDPGQRWGRHGVALDEQPQQRLLHLLDATRRAKPPGRATRPAPWNSGTVRNVTRNVRWPRSGERVAQRGGPRTATTTPVGE